MENTYDIRVEREYRVGDCVGNIVVAIERIQHESPEDMEKRVDAATKNALLPEFGADHDVDS